AVVAAAKQADPDRPVFINVTPHGLGMKIGGLPGDIMAFDRYGFGFDGSKLADIGVTARAAVDAVRPRPRPVWAFLQGFGHDYWVPRCPTPDEMTAQVYLSLVSGVTGYMFFNGVVLAEDTWQRTIQTGDELRMLMPLLADSEEAQIQSTNREIRFLARKKNGRIFLIAVNPSISAQSCTFTVDNRLYGCREIFAGSTPTLSNGKMTVEFRPLERRCFELF
ncbi:MAG: hypothetical protein J6S21_05750, partial [Victivallales bacterium]|nr:hypothetical protein [Victivallales bacterium]